MLFLHDMYNVTHIVHWFPGIKGLGNPVGISLKKWLDKNLIFKLEKRAHNQVNQALDICSHKLNSAGICL